MNKKHLDAKGKGLYDYDYKNDLLMFKIKDRHYTKSIDFGNFIVDIDNEGFITGLRLFDASKLFKLPKIALKGIRNFEFHTSVEDKIIKIQLMFTASMRNKPIIRQGQDFIREALNSNIKDSEAVCTV